MADHVFTIEDGADEADPKAKLQVTVHSTFLGVEIRIEGYGECVMEEGHGSPIFLEFYQGELVLRVWGDINSEEPTHRISLEGARESCRKPETAGS